MWHQEMYDIYSYCTMNEWMNGHNEANSITATLQLYKKGESSKVRGW